MELPDGRSGTESKLLSDCPPPRVDSLVSPRHDEDEAGSAGTIPRSLFMALLERPPPAASCLSSCLLSFSSFLIFSLLFHFFFSLCAFSFSHSTFIAMYLVLLPPSISPLPPFSFLNSISSSNQCPCLYYNHMIVGLFSSKAALSPWLSLPSLLKCSMQLHSNRKFPIFHPFDCKSRQSSFIPSSATTTAGTNLPKAITRRRCGD